ncbi:MAG: hypothetical protein ACEY3J_02095 [Arsenophonus sp.]
MVANEAIDVLLKKFSAKYYSAKNKIKKDQKELIVLHDLQSLVRCLASKRKTNPIEFDLSTVCYHEARRVKNSSSKKTTNQFNAI